MSADEDDLTGDECWMTGGVHDMAANECEITGDEDDMTDENDDRAGEEDGVTGDEQLIIDMTRRWLERAVIGLGLCPFAQSAYAGGRVRFHVSGQRTAAGLLADLRAELIGLQSRDSKQCETTLLIHPYVLKDFIEYNDFLEVCEAAVLDLGLEGELQVASFHPGYQFAGTQVEDIENYTNRSPYPMLHLLRESSIERALAGVAEPDDIYLDNILTLRELGHAGWLKLWAD